MDDISLQEEMTSYKKFTRSSALRLSANTTPRSTSPQSGCALRPIVAQEISECLKEIFKMPTMRSETRDDDQHKRKKNPRPQA